MMFGLLVQMGGHCILGCGKSWDGELWMVELAVPVDVDGCVGWMIDAE